MTTSNATPVQSPQGHDAAMAAAFDNAQARATAEPTAGNPAPTQGGNERPSWLPEKFQTPEDLAQAYRQLEARFSQQQQNQKQTTQQQQQTPSQAEAKEQLASVGLDYSAMEREYLETGKLSEDRYKQLEAAGITRDMVDAFIAGQEAIAAQIQSEVFDLVGGQEKYQEMVAWASKNLTPSQIEAYDRAVTSNDRDAIFLAVEGLKARYAAAGGIEPNLISGSGTTASGNPFRSTAELTAAMRDPRYAKDPAYRAEVMERLKNSNHVF
jgi:Phage T7 capsid assembly protein.